MLVGTTQRDGTCSASCGFVCVFMDRRVLIRSKQAKPVKSFHIRCVASSERAVINVPRPEVSGRRILAWEEYLVYQM